MLNATAHVARTSEGATHLNVIVLLARRERRPGALPLDETIYVLQFELVGDDGQPVIGESYRVELPDGSVAEGLTDAAGRVRVEGSTEGGYKISFPNLPGNRRRSTSHSS